MELRSCSHMHFIKAIKGGVVINFMNVDSHGKPTLVFKHIKDFYDNEDAKTHSLSMLRSMDDCMRIKVNRTCLPITDGEPIGSDSGTYGFDSHATDDSDVDDLSFNILTLKQLKERCKTKKRKLSKFVDLTKEGTEACFPVKQECCDLLMEEDQLDLGETLSSWKSKLTKNSKAKKKRMHEHVPIHSQSSISVFKSKHIPSDQSYLQSTSDLPPLINVKVEVPDPDYSDRLGIADDCLMAYNGQVEVSGPDYSGSQNVTCVSDDSACCEEQAGVSEPSYSGSQDVICVSDASSAGCNEQVEVPASDCSMNQSVICIANDSSFNCNAQMGSSGVVVSEMHENDNECVLDIRDSIVSTELQKCCVNEISSEFRQAQPNPLPNVGPTILETFEVDNLEATNPQTSVFPASEFEEGFIAFPQAHGIPLQTISLTKEQNFSSASAISEIKDTGYITPLQTQNISPQALVPTNEHNPVSLLTASEFMNEEHTHPLALDISPQLLSPTKQHTSDICVSTQSSCLHSNNGVQVPGSAFDDSFHCMESTYGGVACVFEDAHAEGFPSTLQVSAAIIPSSKCLSPTSCLDPEDDDMPATKVKQLPMSAVADTARNCSSQGHSCDTNNDELTTSAEMGNCQHFELQNRPERLFSTRKAISPTSQEKLCRAMDSIYLRDDLEPYKCKIKLRFGKRMEGRAPAAGSDLGGDQVNTSPGGPEQISRNDVTIIPKQMIRRRKTDKRSPHPKGILKVPQLSRAQPHLSNTCTSSQSYSQSAIAFSQRQMHDIECLAMKLAKELKSMKDIVEETMISDICQAPMLRYSADEVRTAIENANKVEETAKRWLSMMARDCNRFCKIMRLSESESGASANAIHKERKKITFADEAGGELCHVKFFCDGMASTLASNDDKQELLAK